MAQKKETLPIRVDVDLQNGGTITYATEVIATIAGVAANEVEGIAGMCASGGIGEILGRNRNITRGVKVEVGSQEAAVELYTMVEYGYPIQKVASDVQENVRKALESLTGLHVVRVDVHVQGVSFEKEKQAAQSNLEAGRSAGVLTEAPAEPKPEEKPAEEKPAEEKPAAEEPVAAEPAEQPADEQAVEAPAAEAPAQEPEAAAEEEAEASAEAPAAPEASAEEPAKEPAEEPAPEEKPAPRKKAPGRKRC